ncbi:MAG: glycosyltransferase, partial [Candidatus Kariarchaeaceae archaeon]
MQNTLVDHNEKMNRPGDVQVTGRIEIPTTDAQAALEFCQALAESLRIKSNGIVVTKDEFKLAARPARPAVSVVIPVYDEEENLPLLYQRLTEVLEENEPHYEFVFVDDGSRDRSPEILQELSDQDPHVVVVQLARNFGHQIAISAGLD